MTDQHTLDWNERHRLALTVTCPYCHQDEGQDCVDLDGRPLGSQPCHVVREVYASKESGEPLLVAPEPPPDERPSTTARRTGVVAKQRDTCNHCDAKLLWAQSRNDVAMPLDAEPSLRGNVFVSTEAGVLRADVVGKRSAAAAMRAAGKRMHVHHQVTCPFASRWRRK